MCDNVKNSLHYGKDEIAKRKKKPIVMSDGVHCIKKMETVVCMLSVIDTCYAMQIADVQCIAVEREEADRRVRLMFSPSTTEVVIIRVYF